MILALNIFLIYINTKYIFFIFS